MPPAPPPLYPPLRTLQLVVWLLIVVKRVSNVDRDKLSNSSCCRFVAKTRNKVDRIGDLSPVSATQDFVASVYRALHCTERNILRCTSVCNDHVGKIHEATLLTTLLDKFTKITVQLLYLCQLYWSTLFCQFYDKF